MTKPSNVIQIDPESEYTLARAASQRAKAERDRLKAEIDAMQIELFEASEKPKDAGSDAHAIAFLDGKPVPEGPQTTRLRLDEAKGRFAVLERAVAIAAERAKAARKKIDKITVSAARPQHAESVKRIAAALVELSRAIEAEERLRHSLPGGALSLTPMAFPAVGWLSHADSPVNFWLKRAKGLGFLPANFDAKADRLAAE